jgi:hypothetical protein
LFLEYQISSNKDAIINDLNLLSVDAFQYTQRPESMGGGDGTYDGYSVPSRLASNDNASYNVGGAPVGPGQGTSHGNGHNNGHGNGYGQGKGGGKDHAKGNNKGTLTLVGTSSQGYGTVTMTINDSSKVTTVTFTGKFQ